MMYYPTRPFEYQRYAKRFVQLVGRKSACEQLGWTEEELDNRLKGIGSMARYRKALKLCLEKNRNLSLEEIAKRLSIHISFLKELDI